jgi:membrane associated rhomboid family serine protease
MNWLQKLERKYSHLAIKNLMYYIVFLNAVIYVLILIDTTGSVIPLLTLDPALVLQGEVWRLISYIIIPPNASPIFIIFILYFYYMVGTGLEQEWGTFKFNMYYLIGMLGTTAATFITGGGATAVYLNMSLFLAFAYIYPDFQILLFLLLPVKVKYLAWLNWFFIGFTVLSGTLPAKAAALVSIANFLLFFGKDVYKNLQRRQQVNKNRKRFQSHMSDRDE